VRNQKMTENSDNGKYKHYVVASEEFSENRKHIIVARLLAPDPKNKIDPSLELRSNDPIHLKAFGDIFPVLNIERYNRQSESTDLDHLYEDPGNSLLWSEEFVTTSEADMRIADLLLAKEHGKDVAVVSGTTAGRGKAFGGAFSSANHADIDGFITKIDAENGRIIRSVRLHTLPGYTDEIRGMCIDHDENAVYIVGSSNNYEMKPAPPNIEIDYADAVFTAFIKKIDLETLDLVWIHQVKEVQAKSDVFGRGCSIETDSEGKGNVYFSGIVRHGGRVRGDIESCGGDDIFVSYYNPNGHQIFLNQVGTIYDDNIISTESNWIIHDGIPRGGVVLSTGTDDGTPANNINNIDLVFEVTPQNGVNVLFGELPLDTNGNIKALSRTKNKLPNGEFGEISVTSVMGLSLLSVVMLALITACFRTKWRGEKGKGEKVRTIDEHLTKVAWSGGSKRFEDKIEVTHDLSTKGETNDII